MARHDWSAFCQLDSMHSHWKRPGWSPTTRAYYWMLTFDAAAFGEQLELCRQAIRHLPFDLIDDEGLHLTLGRVGPAHDIGQAAAERLAHRAQHRIPEAFDLKAAPLTASRGAARYSVAPWTPLLALHEHLAQATTATGLPPLKPTSHLRPHIGIGYCSQTLATRPVRNALAPLRKLPPVTVRVDSVDLVLLRREPGAYRWDTVHSLPLAPFIEKPRSGTGENLSIPTS
ncbi:2'-5' RNA ligase family protein [Streptomyces sp. NBC_00470]|uniref:2'-5' RNA ligase family protein n=1 Tax=Streptomyces sp. NBC_00470 TaxID=2975753 RepID=UPI0030E33654